MDFTWVPSLYFSAQSIINRFFIAIVIFLVGLVLGRLAGNFVTRVLSELEVDAILKKATKKKTKIAHRVGKAVSFILYIIAAIIAIDQLGIATPLLTWAALGILIIVLIALVLGIKDYIPNIIACFVIHKNELFSIGDTVKVGNVEGVVKAIGLSETVLQSKEDTIYVPNASFTKGHISVKAAQ